MLFLLLNLKFVHSSYTKCVGVVILLTVIIITLLIFIPHTVDTQSV